MVNDVIRLVFFAKGRASLLLCNCATKYLQRINLREGGDGKAVSVHLFELRNLNRGMQPIAPVCLRKGERYKRGTQTGERHKGDTKEGETQVKVVTRGDGKAETD